MIRLLCTLLAFFLIQKGAHFLTDGFRYQELLTTLPNQPRWEVPFNKEILPLLNQSFTYLGSGDQCYAFVGKDGCTVLKFFRHETPFSRLLREKPRYLDPLFNSCHLAYTKLREETGLIYLHLNKTKDLFPTISFTDKIGIRHTIDLNETEFLLQQKGDLFFPRLTQELAAGHTDQAKQMIASFFSCLQNCVRKGVVDKDPSIRRNLGFNGERTIFIDVGSFIPCQNPSQDLNHKIRRFKRYLAKHKPDLLPFFEEQVANFDQL